MTLNKKSTINERWFWVNRIQKTFLLRIDKYKQDKEWM